MCTVSEFMYLFYFIIVKICNLTVRQINLYTIFSKYHNAPKFLSSRSRFFNKRIQKSYKKTTISQLIKLPTRYERRQNDRQRKLTFDKM